MPWRGAKLKVRGRLAKAAHALRKDVTSSAFVKVSASFFLDSRWRSELSGRGVPGGSESDVLQVAPLNGGQC